MLHGERTITYGPLVSPLVSRRSSLHQPHAGAHSGSGGHRNPLSLPGVGSFPHHSKSLLPRVPLVSVGRSKAQRWSDSSPASGQSGDARPSFLEALLTGTNLVRGGTTISTRNCDAPAAVSSPAPAAAARPNEAHRPVVFRGAKGSVMVASQASASATVQSASHPPISSLVRDSARPTSRPQRNGSVFWRRAGGDFQPAAERQRFVKLHWASQPDPLAQVPLR